MTMNQTCLHKLISTVANARGPVTEEYIKTNADLDFSDQQFTPNHTKVKKLVDVEVLKDVSPPNEENTYILNTTDRTVISEGTTIKAERDGSVRITTETDGQLTIQPTATDVGSYQLTTWWDDETSLSKNVADTHLHLPETRLLEELDAQNERNIGQTPMIIVDEIIESAPNVICELIDPAPISNQLIGGVAHLTVLSNDDKNGFDVTVTRSHDRLSTPLQSQITLPQINPVQQTDEFYEVINETRLFKTLGESNTQTSDRSNEPTSENPAEQLLCESCDEQDKVIVEYYNTRMDCDTIRDVRTKRQLFDLFSRIEDDNIEDHIVRVDCAHCAEKIYDTDETENKITLS